MEERLTAQFTDWQGNTLGPTLLLPTDTTPTQLELALKQLQAAEATKNKNEGEEDDEDEETREQQRYAFFCDDVEIMDTIGTTIDANTRGERVLRIVFHKQALFRVKAATRCSGTLDGHTEAVLAVAFSPDGRHLASGAGDATVRFWDLGTETPIRGVPETRHSSWVLALAWSPDGSLVASGDMKGQVQLWDGRSGVALGRALIGHSGAIHALAWQPLHLASVASGPLLASASKDATIRVWEPRQGRTLYVLTQHTQAVTCLRWSGSDILWSGSRDRSLKAWDMSSGTATGRLLLSLNKHAHWINSMALSTDYVLRTGAFDPAELARDDVASGKAGLTCSVNDGEAAAAFLAAKAQALALYRRSHQGQEVLVTASDDATLFLWKMSLQGVDGVDSVLRQGEMPVAVRLVGHQALINHVAFSPDGGRWLLSASFDKSVRLWDGKSGKFLALFKGHVAPIYQVAWSSDSRLFASASKDSTLKVWSISRRKCLHTLAGHRDQVFALDWSPDGERLVSGSKDKTLKIWKN